MIEIRQIVRKCDRKTNQIDQIDFVCLEWWEIYNSKVKENIYNDALPQSSPTLWKMTGSSFESIVSAVNPESTSSKAPRSISKGAPLSDEEDDSGRLNQYYYSNIDLKVGKSNKTAQPSFHSISSHFFWQFSNTGDSIGGHTIII